MRISDWSSDVCSSDLTLQQADPGNPGNANLKAAALGLVGEFDEALLLYEQVLQGFGKQPKIWMSYGHMLKTVGRQADAVAAYRQARFGRAMCREWVVTSV